MKALPLFCLLIFATGTTLIQSCKKLERIDPPCPTLMAITPAGAHVGDIVSIIGKNFLPGLPELYKVKIGDSTLSANDVIVPDADTLRFKVPSGIQNWDITVSVVGGTVCNTQTLELIHYHKATGVSQLAGGLSSPAGLDLDRDGNVVVAEYTNHQIKVIATATGEIKKTYGRAGQARCDIDSTKIEDAYFDYPTDIEVDSTGNIYILEEGGDDIRIIRAIKPNTVQIYAGTCDVIGIDTFPVPRLEA
jgi:hypothetical protein